MYRSRQGWAQGKKRKPEVKILGEYCLKKMQYFPPWKLKKNGIQVKIGGHPSQYSDHNWSNMLRVTWEIKTKIWVHLIVTIYNPQINHFITFHIRIYRIKTSRKLLSVSAVIKPGPRSISPGLVMWSRAWADSESPKRADPSLTFASILADSSIHLVFCN